MAKGSSSRHAPSKRSGAGSVVGDRPAVRSPEPDDGDESSSPQGLGGLYSSPEFLIRRAHQVASAAFASACADLDLTPSQYAALFALRQQVRIGQNALGRLVALDRSTTSLVVKSLKDRNLVTAKSDLSDKRKAFLELSTRGRLVLAQAEQRSALSSQALMARFDQRQAEEFLRMLRTLSESTGLEGSS